MEEMKGVYEVRRSRRLESMKGALIVLFYRGACIAS
jgi:hypothetical protein